MVMHQVREGWGLYPVMFGVPTYSVTMFFAIACGLLLYFFNTRGQKSLRSDEVGKIALAAFIGSIVGAKLPLILLNLRYGWQGIMTILAGRTVVGGMVGGLLGVLVVKHHLGIKRRYGNVLAPSIALGMGIGRIGCFLTGCCYGVPITCCNLGIDYGDGILRYPTQLFEMIFCFIAFIILQLSYKKMKPGRALTFYFLSYFVFRFFIEFIRVTPVFYGLRVYQWIALGGIVFLVLKIFFMQRKEKSVSSADCTD